MRPVRGVRGGLRTPRRATDQQHARPGDAGHERLLRRLPTRAWVGRRPNGTRGRGPCCTTSGRGGRRHRGSTAAGTARPNASSSTATTTTGFTTSSSPLRWLASEVEMAHPKNRDDQYIESREPQQGSRHLRSRGSCCRSREAHASPSSSSNRFSMSGSSGISPLRCAFLYSYSNARSADRAASWPIAPSLSMNSVPCR